MLHNSMCYTKRWHCVIASKTKQNCSLQQFFFSYLQLQYEKHHEVSKNQNIILDPTNLADIASYKEEKNEITKRI